MSHVVVVDGHNAIHALRMRGAPIEDLRHRLLARVRAVTRRGAVVFFDGHPSPGEFGGTEDRGVTVRYAGDREADDAIVEHVRDERRPARLLVVTDDLELARRVEQIGASTQRIGQLFHDAEEVPEKDTLRAGRFCASDFGLPDVVDLDEAPSKLDPTPVAVPPRIPRRGGRK